MDWNETDTRPRRRAPRIIAAFGAAALAALAVTAGGHQVHAATPGSLTINAHVTLPAFPSATQVCNVALGGTVTGALDVNGNRVVFEQAALSGSFCYNEPNCPPSTGDASGTYSVTASDGATLSGSFSYKRTGTAAVITTSGSSVVGGPFATATPVDDGTGAGNFAATGVAPTSFVPPCPSSTNVNVTVVSDISVA